MNIPSRDHCLLLMEQVAMPLNIWKHSLMVAELSLYLGRLLNQNSIRLNLDLLEAGGLLHDIAKARSIATGEKHDVLGARMLEERGFPILAPIVKDHVTLDLVRVHGPVTESLIVNYADKRIKHDQVVTLEARFHDLVDRYAKTREHQAIIMEKLDLYLTLEQEIFDHLAIRPTETELMQLTLEGYPGVEMEEYERQQIDCGTLGRREIC